MYEVLGSDKLFLWAFSHPSTNLMYIFYKSGTLPLRNEKRSMCLLSASDAHCVVNVRLLMTDFCAVEDSCGFVGYSLHRQR